MSESVGNTSKFQSPAIQFEHGGTTDLLRSISPEAQKRRQIVLSADSHLEEKLEAYEDIIDSEVGDTNLLRARNLEREFGIRQLFLKFEGGNPTGTQKDRIAFAQCMDALRRGYDTITLATCGNYGAACAFAAYFAGLRCIIFIPENYHTKRIREMEELGAEILRVPGDYENAVETSTRYAAEHEYFDANPGGDNTILQLQAYGEIAFEVYDELRDAPKMVAGPVSNGTLMAGIHKGFVRLFRRGKTSRIPRTIAGSSAGKNPIVTSFLKGLSLSMLGMSMLAHDTFDFTNRNNWQVTTEQQEQSRK